MCGAAKIGSPLQLRFVRAAVGVVVFLAQFRAHLPELLAALIASMVATIAV